MKGNDIPAKFKSSRSLVFQSSEVLGPVRELADFVRVRGQIVYILRFVGCMVSLAAI